MQKFITFVNGSNLFTTCKHFDLFIDDYEEMFHYLFEQAVDWWRSTVVAPSAPPAQHLRVYWHVVDSMDDWDVNNPKTRQYLLERFQDDREVRARWIAEADRLGNRTETARLEQTAFNLCLDDCRAWYEKRQSVLHGMNRFHHAVEASTDYIEICRCGRWKIDLLHKTVNERGLDVCLAVDMIALLDHYDVAIIVGGDPDGIASLEYLKSRGKQVGVVEIQRGQEQVDRTFATPLKMAADFIVPIYDNDLVKQKIATRSSSSANETFALRDAA